MHIPIIKQILQAIFCCLLIILSSNNAYARQTTDTSELPEIIELKTTTQTFTHKFFFALQNGRIWVRSRTDSGEAGRWHLLNRTGLPGPSPEKEPYKNITTIKAISADGDNLIAISDQQTVYYTKTFNWKWKDHFSAIPLTKKLSMPIDSRAFGISHRGSFMKYYSDIDGNQHRVGAGVTTLYQLANNGHMIYYADPWLPPSFSHIVDTPDKGTFIASNMSVSGSTIFIINAAGEMYTRLYDYDTSGQNPVLPYSYKRETRKETRRGSTRSLPPEDWRAQPRIPGTITDSITIFQTGEGNSAFELRVEGINKKDCTGYYSKPVYGDNWTFIQTNQPLNRPLLKTSVKDQNLHTAPKVKTFSGKLHRGATKISAELSNFWVFSPPATLRFTVSGKSIEAKLHMRKYKHRKNGSITCNATIELPRTFTAATDDAEQKLFKELFDKSALIDMFLVIQKDSVKGAEDLHIIGIDDIADTIISLKNKNGPKGELQARFHKRLHLSFDKPR